MNNDRQSLSEANYTYGHNLITVVVIVIVKKELATVGNFSAILRTGT